MNLIDVLKQYRAVRAILTRLRRSPRGRQAIRAAVGLLDREMAEKRGSTTSVPAGGLRDQEFNLRRVEFRDRGATPALLALAESQSANTIAWQILPRKTWLVFAAAQLEAEDRAGAERTLRTYAAKLGLAGLDECLPVAAFARELGLRTPEIDRAAVIADVLCRSREGGRFRDLVTGRSVAVVGNGPGNIGTRRGAEIDAHDVVIRFNNFPTGFESDYGTRTDIWVRGAHEDVRDRPSIEEFSLVLWEMDFFRNLIEHPSHAEILFRDALIAPDKLAYLDSSTKASLREASGLLLPTSGAQVIWALLQARGSLDGVDVYGFSTIDHSGDFGHYFDGLGDMAKRHDTDGEGRFLRELLTGGAAHDASQEGIVVFNCAYRDYDPARGRTGGPAGVLATQRVVLGEDYGNHTLRYIFDEGDKGALRRSLPHLAAGLSGKPVDLILGAEYVRSHPDVLKAVRDGRRILMVCHELGSALGAYLLGVPYVIVYHQQGSTLQEMISIGREPTPHEIATVTRLEELICSNASRMYFPSRGAREAFRSTADPSLAMSVSFAEEALYNTLAEVPPSEQATPALIAELSRELRLPKKEDDLDVFMSVGDWNGDKGLDRVPALLDAYVRRTGRRVLWIAIGSAIDRKRFEEAKDAQKGWSFDSRLIGTRMKHDRLLALLAYADYYVMMHRNSIFDLATLEAMRAGKGVVLSPAGGNNEVDIEDNIVFVSEESIDEAVSAITERDLVEWGAQNRRVYNENFALEHFAERYRAMLNEQIALIGGHS